MLHTPKFRRRCSMQILRTGIVPRLHYGSRVILCLQKPMRIWCYTLQWNDDSRSTCATKPSKACWLWPSNLLNGNGLGLGLFRFVLHSRSRSKFVFCCSRSGFLHFRHFSVLHDQEISKWISRQEGLIKRCSELALCVWVYESIVLQHHQLRRTRAASAGCWAWKLGLRK